ncbi:hypothetical protein P3T76_006529 [Phytophthora citrophthora]|uniref:Probable pectate lyase F n=1 Tax=Phytophthora citrophthora TaxID=4793 RepID=A0AAD9GPE9_9STRA|nr:hypothetical protein P3T76_006529 [Phytophthora citrophthora]
MDLKGHNTKSMDKLVQLQAALRAIETGQRLESVDGVLVRQVLQQSRKPQQSTPEPDAKELYRELLALRKANSKQHTQQTQSTSISVEGKTTPQKVSPKKTTSIRPVDTRLEAAPTSPERGTISNNDKTIAEELAVSTKETRILMQTALILRKKELRRSEKAVAQADADLREELARTERILPSKFLFERNLAGDRALEAARNVLTRFQHRFYKLYFHNWWGATLELRLQAQRRAVAEIVRVYRGHQGRRDARRLRKELDVLKAQKRQLLAFRIKFRSSQALKIQMAWRRCLRYRAIKHRQARQAAAVVLQKAFRTRQWQSQSLVNALANTRKLFAAVGLQKLYRGHRIRRKLREDRQRQQQEERVKLVLLRSMSSQARAVWMIERRGAGHLIAGMIFPYAVRRRWHRLHFQLRRQRAAECIARVVCRWFGVEVRREAARTKQVNEWLALAQREHERSRNAAVLIQKHLRRWVQQRKFLMSESRRKKIARRARLEEKARRMGNRPSPSLQTRWISQPRSTQLKEGNKTIRHTEANAAAIVQCCYRRYRSRRRIQLKAWRNEAVKAETRVQQRHKAATEIQRHVRGVCGRKLARERRAERLLSRFVLRWKWRRIQKRHRAARKIGLWFKHKRTQRLAKLWHVEKKKREAASIQLLRWYRLQCLLPSRLRQISRFVRKREETFVFCDQSLRLCKQHLGDEFAVQSLGVGLEDALRPLLTDLVRSPTKSKSPTKQKVSKRAKTHVTVAFPILQMAFLVASGWKSPFIWNELDGKTLFQTKLERTKAITFFRALPKRGKQVAHQVRQPETNVTVPSPTRHSKKSPVKGAKAKGDTFSSVDVDVAVARATGGAKGALDFATFVRVLGQLGEISLSQHSTDLYWGRLDGSEARVLASLWLSVLSYPSMQPLALAFDAFTSKELSRHASCLQRLFIRQHNKRLGLAILVEMKQNLRNQELSRVAIQLQTQARGFLARRELRHRMQQTYEKFIDPTWGLPYWMNPRTGYSTWQKPRVLRAEDVQCEPVPFPPPERTLKARCNGEKDCERCAEWVCYDCDEFFCLQCFGEYHNAKPISEEIKDEEEEETTVKRDHELEKLQLCGLCKFQLASRRCLDCDIKVKAKEKAPQDCNSEAFFCDVCFSFLHRRGGLKTHRTEALLEQCTSCIPDDDKPRTGFGDAVQWECEACGAPPLRVCGRCALQSHPVESCGELRPVPLQTLGRQQRTKRLREEQEARDRADLNKMRARALRARQERCARKIQAFWRSQAPILHARRLVAARRKDKSEQWLRRQEDLRLAKRLAYRAKNVLGIAQPMGSDTPVERRLRSLHALARRQLSIRARFFGLLIDEYVTVGIPLPGLGLLHPGSNEIWTSEDLRGWVHNRQTIRFKKLTDQEAQPAERALCAWRQLEHWEKLNGEGEKESSELGGFAPAEDTDTTWLAEVHPKQQITESLVPLTEPYASLLLKKKRFKADEEEVVEDVPVAMFLVEFSLDPRRTVWISHSLAERFWEWKRLKLLARRERSAQRQRAKDYKKHQEEIEEKQKQEEELRQQQEAANAPSADEVTDPVPITVDPEQQWSEPTSTWATNDPYYNYYPPVNPTEATADWTGYEGYSSNYPADYNYVVQDTTPTFGEEAAGLVDSTNYYATGDASNDSNWYGTEYSAYDQAAPTDYNNWDSTYSAYSSTTGYVEPQPLEDPNASWYANNEDPNYDPTYNYTDGWQNYPDQNQGSASSYSIDLPSADGYTYPYSSTEEDPTTQAAAQWEEVFDPTTQQTYYVNRITNETAWQIPS